MGTKELIGDSCIEHCHFLDVNAYDVFIFHLRIVNDGLRRTSIDKLKEKMQSVFHIKQNDMMVFG